jgi:hypothetical protein
MRRLDSRTFAPRSHPSQLKRLGIAKRSELINQPGDILMKRLG